MEQIVAAIRAGATGPELAALALPDTHRGAVLQHADVGVFDGVAVAERDPGRTLAVREVPTVEPAADEVLLAVMASSINFTTVWSAIHHPVDTFGFLARLGRSGGPDARHHRDAHVVGSDAAGVVLRVGAGVRRWAPGDRVVVHPAVADPEDPDTHADAMRSAALRIWGYETNFGGLAELAVVKASQLLPKAPHLSWEEAAVNGLCASTSYRMLVGEHGARMKQGDVVLVWGASGGVGGYAVQLVRNGGGTAVGVVSSPARAELVRALGAEAVIDRAAAGYRFWSDPHTPDEGEWRRLGADVRRAAGGDDPDIVFEHPGRETMGASMYVARRGGTVVTCAATSGWDVELDARHLWTRTKRLVGSHLANQAEAAAANRLVHQGRIQPLLTSVRPLAEVAAAAAAVHANAVTGKVGVLCLAPGEGLGIDDPELRARIGEERITAARRLAGG